MPTAAELQALHDELRELGAVFVQALNIGDQERARLADAFWRSAIPKPPPEPKPYVPKSTESERPEKNYGADISTLIRMIENGEL